ncbi:MAG: heme-binding protein [Betaproteobacteria bacterium]|nr:MAG: heme-binding protein [Betaproteobacteria bacterium]
MQNGLEDLMRRWKAEYAETPSLSHHASAARGFDVSLLSQQAHREKPMSRISAGLQVLVLVSGAAAAGVQAQGLVTTHKLSAALANQLVGDSVAACAQKGYQVVAVVVDLDGVRQAVLRGDGAPIHSMDNAYYKAYTIASLGLSRKEETTKQIADRMAKNPPTNVPQTQLPNVTYAQGAIAIMAGGNTIGGLGVSGAPGGQFDEECARTALAKIKDRMK